MKSNARFLYAMASVLAICWLVPIYLIGLSALTPREAVSAWPKSLWPGTLSLDTLSFFVHYTGVWTAVLNSVIVALLSMLFAVLLGAPAGYALARYDFAGQNVYRLLIVMTRAFPLAILALPLATRFIAVGLYDTPLGVALVHTALALPFSILVSSSLFMGIPREFEEAAWTLGCTRVQAFAKIVLPLALPGMAATMIFSFVISWNEVFAASVLTLNQRTLTAFLFASLEESPLHFRFAGGFFLILPSLVFIFMVRKYLFAMWGISNR
ncbi:carbohydrate ABC transporter permease [Verminephrobacter aporrectodeae subsp. tuberculatae]|uniref:Carbohydrate ABC transporter permease n=1 Tax=Verminephrobacter aporrectodeae subsp. tuberculatae TaxID=1110392 RepID=A0ABT3KRS8_9BURK|nr:carbohydrate ABC transporter permease [Verminephrobacter aporrectodeae]MCW5321039.1 carbohydrate ABC transporter permease [Verminephrobacter aporrectodeae subsp. tuberculatae]MCW8199546.1 carbohydrate ABC transporter permease [Verminephrobacter aporrectodeae subsp. tuberculatae]